MSSGGEVPVTAKGPTEEEQGLEVEELAAKVDEPAAAPAEGDHDDEPQRAGDSSHSNNKDNATGSSTHSGGLAYRLAMPNIPFRPATKPPKDTLMAVYKAGQYKANLRLEVLMVQCFMAGWYIAMAGQFLIAGGGGVLGAILFPTGLLAVILTSAELFTGDALVFVASVLGGQVKVRYLLRNWTVAWCFNFLGAVCWAALLGYASDALTDMGPDTVALAIKIAEKKAAQPLYSTFIKGIGANFLVCVGIWQATCAEEAAGKVLSLWPPIVAFVVMGFDHCIANMFYIPMGMMLGADVTVGRMFAEIFMATFGNIIGGGVLVGAIYWFVFDSLALDAMSTVRAALRSAGHRISEVAHYPLHHHSHHHKASGGGEHHPHHGDEKDLEQGHDPGKLA